MRARKQDSAGTRTYFLYDGTSPLVEMDSSGNYKSEFVYGPAGLISHSRASLGTVFLAYDALGSVQSLWSDSGSLVSSRVYDAYGSQAGGIAASSTYDDPEIGYNGQAGYITDSETGLVICGHRYYDPSAGRWLNRDPVGYDGGINTYRYCGNNPVMWDDPSGFAVISGGGSGTLICVVGVTCDATISFDTCSHDVAVGIDGGVLGGPAVGVSIGPQAGYSPDGSLSNGGNVSVGGGGFAGWGGGSVSGSYTAPVNVGGDQNHMTGPGTYTGSVKYGPTIGGGPFGIVTGGGTLDISQTIGEISKGIKSATQTIGSGLASGINGIYGPIYSGGGSDDDSGDERTP